MSNIGHYIPNLKDKDLDNLIKRLFISYLFNILQFVGIVLLLLKLIA